MTIRTAKGTNATKISGTTLTISSVSLVENDCLLVGVTGATESLPDTVTWGTFKLAMSRQRTNTTSGHAVSIWTARRIQNTSTRDIVATWSSSIGARAIVATSLDNPVKRDVGAGGVQNDSTSPSTVNTFKLDIANSYCWGLFASEGPNSDTAPTLGNDFTIGQRDGTAGAPPISNLTLLEVYKELTSDISVQALDGSDATSRNWANVLVVYMQTNTMVWDKNGSEVVTGDFVEYNGAEYEVLDCLFQRNVLSLATVGLVSATSCEVMR